MTGIESLRAWEVLDSRGWPTVRVECSSTDGVSAAASVPSGRSRGANEAHELRDGMGRYVVLLAVGVEHVLLLVLLASEYLLACAPAWVRLVLARRDAEERAGHGPGGLGTIAEGQRRFGANH